jgi:hypothetical protein
MNVSVLLQVVALTIGASNHALSLQHYFLGTTHLCCTMRNTRDVRMRVRFLEPALGADEPFHRGLQALFFPSSCVPTFFSAR